MDNNPFLDALREGSKVLGLSLTPAVEAGMLLHQKLLAQWNPRVNLTSVVDGREAAEVHFLDSLACVPWIQGAKRLLDIGSGGGFPGLPIKLALPELELTLVDSVGKKVGFLKQAIVTLRLSKTQALHVRLDGEPLREGIALANRITARAVALPRLLPMVAPYLAPEGALLGTLGAAEAENVEAEVERAGWRTLELRTFQLPFSGAKRTLTLVQPKRST